MKNTIDVWVNSDQLEEGIYLCMFDGNQEGAEVVRVESDGNGNAYLWAHQITESPAPAWTYGEQFKFAPLEMINSEY